jgi:hypothetical protein
MANAETIRDYVLDEAGGCDQLRLYHLVTQMLVILNEVIFESTASSNPGSSPERAFIGSEIVMANTTAEVFLAHLIGPDADASKCLLGDRRQVVALLARMLNG